MNMSNKYIDKNKKKPLKIQDFVPVIPWSQIKYKMYAKDFKSFNKWMTGQTCTKDGIYECDLKRFLEGRSIID